MKIDGDWNLDEIAAWRRDMDFMLTPRADADDRVAAGVQPVTWAGGFSLVIPSTAREKEGAFKLIQFLSSRKAYRFLEQGKKESAESQGQLYLPHPTSNRRLFEERIVETIDQNPDVPPRFKQAYVAIKGMLPNTLVRPAFAHRAVAVGQTYRSIRSRYQSSPRAGCQRQR